MQQGKHEMIMGAPRISYDVVHLGPDDGCREEYLRLLSIARGCKNAGDYARAASILEEAESMVKEKWREVIHNLVPTAGKNDIIDKYFKASGYTAAWYMGLAGSGTKAAADTLASHGGWSESNPYSGNRPAITWGTTSSGSNVASLITFSINATATVAGAFVASVNSGSSGILYSVADFSSPRSVASGDTMNITPSISIL